MQRLFTLCFPYFYAMQNICELYVKTMFIMFAPLLGYLKSKQTLFKSYLGNYIPCSILLCKLYFTSMWILFNFYDWKLSVRSKS